MIVVLRVQGMYHTLAISWWLIVSICLWGEHPIANAPPAAYSYEMIRLVMWTDFTQNSCET